MANLSPHRELAKAAAGYLRRSTDRQEQSLGDQREAIETYAEREGYRVIDWFVDDAISGTSTEGRKAFQALIQTSQKPGCSFRYVLVYDVKRFGRVDTDEAGYYRHLLRQAGIEVVYTSEGFNGGDSDDLIRSVKQWQARAESKDLSKVTIRGQLSVIDKGYWGGGVPPYGYDLLYEDAAGKPIRQVRFMSDGSKEEYDPEGKLLRVHPRGTRLARPKTDRPRLVLSAPERVALIRRIFSLYLDEDLGYRSIAETLNGEGIPSPRDGNWSRTTDRAWSVGTIRSILLNGNYTGDTYWNRRTFSKFHRISGGKASQRLRNRVDKPDWNPEQDWIVVRKTHPAIVDREIFRRVVEERRAGVQRNLRASYRRGTAKTSPYLLSGLLRCACGHSFIGMTSTKGQLRISGEPVRTAYYVCGGYIQKGRAKCVRTMIPKEEIEALIWGQIERRLKVLSEGGEELAARVIQATQRNGDSDPVVEMKDLRAAIESAEARARSLVDGLSEEAADLVKEKLEAIARDRRVLEDRLRALESVAPYAEMSPSALVDDSKIRFSHLGFLRHHGTLLQKKHFLREMIRLIECAPSTGTAQLFWTLCPTPRTRTWERSGIDE